MCGVRDSRDVCKCDSNIWVLSFFSKVVYVHATGTFAQNLISHLCLRNEQLKSHTSSGLFKSVSGD